MSNARALKLAGAGTVLVAGALWFNPPPQLAQWLAIDPPAVTKLPAGKNVSTEQPAQVAVAINPLSALSGDALQETLDRPLFNPGRTARKADPPPPPPPPDATDEPPADPGIQAADLSLLAVAGASDDLVAMVRWTKTNQVYRLKRGQFLSELEIVAVSERQAVLKKDEKVIVLALFAKGRAAGGATHQPGLATGEDQASPDDGSDPAATVDAGADGAVDGEISDEDPGVDDMSGEDGSAEDDTSDEDGAADPPEPPDPEPGAAASDGSTTAE